MRVLIRSGASNEYPQHMFSWRNKKNIYLIPTRVCRPILYFLIISDVIRSVIGSVIWIAVIVTWVVIFQLKRAEWGATADYISFIIPKGEP